MTSARQVDDSAPVSAELLELLVCPIDKQPLRSESNQLVCTGCGRFYPVEQGIPNMIVDEST